MAYQIRKSSRITEELELLGENGNVEKVLKIDIDTDRIMRDYRIAEIKLLNAQKAAREKSSTETLENYGEAVTAFFRLVFGDDNTDEMLDYFSRRYTEMLIQTMPFITDVIKPAIADAAAAQKSRLANNLNFSRRQKRKLGLK